MPYIVESNAKPAESPCCTDRQLLLSFHDTATVNPLKLRIMLQRREPTRRRRGACTCPRSHVDRVPEKMVAIGLHA